MSSIPTYGSSCISIEEITITSDLFPGLGLAQQAVYRYDFKTVPIIGLNKPDILVVYTRPSGQLHLVHVLTSGLKPLLLPPCKKGFLKLQTPQGFKISIPDAYAIRTEGRITVENFTFTEIASFLFFNYTNSF